MAIPDNLPDLFQGWINLNKMVGSSFQTLDFSEIRKYRNQQREIEDKIYEILRNNAPAEIKDILPEECGQMEMGYEKTSGKFYYLMEDPETQESEDELKILAITIDKDMNINTIKDFKHPERG
ncbi:MAG: hypothetical protein BAJALOKI2v1_10008 [Promethearchaeota archaeon]|nr:MAG: hypothetical protein BAJALOKI2v1_10008 [Candidatus Lokiarchaeota archaeon]